MATIYENKSETNEDQQDKKDQDKKDQEEINASFKRLLQLDLEEEMREVNCCIGCKTRVEKWMSFCGATCEKKFNASYEELKIQTELPLKDKR